MAEAGEGSEVPASAGGSSEMDPRRLEELTDLVYRLLKRELIVGRERKGATWSRKWR